MPATAPRDRPVGRRCRFDSYYCDTCSTRDLSIDGGPFRLRHPACPACLPACPACAALLLNKRLPPCKMHTLPAQVPAAAGPAAARGCGCKFCRVGAGRFVGRVAEVDRGQNMHALKKKVKSKTIRKYWQKSVKKQRQPPGTFSGSLPHDTVTQLVVGHARDVHEQLGPLRAIHYHRAPKFMRSWQVENAEAGWRWRADTETLLAAWLVEHCR